MRILLLLLDPETHIERRGSRAPELRPRPHLQLRVAEHDQLGAGLDVVSFDVGQVHPRDPLQAREVGPPLPVLRVLLDQLEPEPVLLAAGVGPAQGDTTQRCN